MSPEKFKSQRGYEIYLERTRKLHTKTDLLFAVLFVLQWVAGIGAAVLISPKTWTGAMSSTHVHLWAAIVLGGLIASAPITLALTQPGRLTTRLVIAVAQACFSALLIHLSGGRIETHFHVFGSLAFLAFYRDWRVLVPATLVVAVDHLFRGIFWPESVFGVLESSPLRALEHAGWVIFEDVFLVWGCLVGDRERRAISAAQAELELVNQDIELQVQQRTQELHQRTRELEESIENERLMEMQLAQAQKLESIGQLAAGIAHEINTPMQFLNDNLKFLRDCSKGQFEVVAAFQQNLYETACEKSWEERQTEVAAIMERCHFERMQKQIPLAIEESLEGIQRVVTIVRAMKEFSHPGTAEKVATNINEAIRSTITISKNRWKYAADVDLQLAEDLPLIRVLPAELNQVLLNLVVNAGDAIAEKMGDEGGSKGTITIRTHISEPHLTIEVEDTGTGVPDEIKAKIFDPFFTTKGVGKGTGQGLSISYDVVVNKHQGKLQVESRPGEGSTFIIHLPLAEDSEEIDFVPEKSESNELAMANG